MLKRLILRCQCGDPKATTEFIRRLRPLVRKIAYHYSNRCAEPLEDMEQEIWLGIFTALPEVDVRIGDPVQFLLKKGKWSALDRIKRRLRHLEEPVAEIYQPDIRSRVEEAVLAHCLREEIKGHLSPIQSTILDLLIAGYSATEVAQQLGCTPANVSYHLARIRRVYQRIEREIL